VRIIRPVRNLLFAPLVVLSIACSPAPTRADDADACKGRGPFDKLAVPDPQTATAIFLAVEPILWPGRDVRHFPLVRFFDEGDHWAVFRTAPIQVNPLTGSRTVIEGGASLN
jgi:hypothetical protein